MEVAVGLDAAVRVITRVVDRGGQLARRRPRRRASTVSRAAPRDLRRAAQRVGVLHARVLGPAVAGDDRAAGAAARAGWRPPRAWPGCGRSACRSAANTRSVPSRPSTLIAAVMSAVASSVAQVGDREHEHAEHPVGAVDQREPLLLAQLDRLDAGRAQRVGGVAQRAARVARPAPRPSARARSARAARGRPSSRASRTRARPA